MGKWPDMTSQFVTYVKIRHLTIPLPPNDGQSSHMFWQVRRSGKYLMKHCIVTPTNDGLNSMNDEIMDNFFIPEHESGACLSHDTTSVDDSGMYPVEFLKSCRACGLPSHRLQLKLAALSKLIRNLASGVSNGTRCIVRAMYNHVLEFQGPTGPRKDKAMFLPRLKLSPSETRGP
jgi:PIF1-like helicase